MTGELVLLVDDEASIVQLTRLYLEREGFRVEAAATGLEAIQKADSLSPSLMVLDVMLPELDGFEVCRRIRNANSDLPIMMLTARDDDIDKILGLELGADDYMTKPFNPRELAARVKAILRRSERVLTNSQEHIEIGLLRINLASREVKCAGDLIDLRAQEFEVLLALARKARRVLTREQLLNLAWGYDFFGQTRTVDMHIAQIRRKLGSCGSCIETVTGVGYKLVD